MNTPTDVPNLDAMEPADLMGFWAQHRDGCASRALFPEGGKGTRRATADLANMASNLATAKQCRARGDIGRALMYEGIAESIYNKLPRFARY